MFPSRGKNGPPSIIKNFITSRWERTGPPETLEQRVLDLTINLQPPPPAFICICYRDRMRRTTHREEEECCWLYRKCIYLFFAQLRSCFPVIRLRDLWSVKTSGWARTGLQYAQYSKRRRLQTVLNVYVCIWTPLHVVKMIHHKLKSLTLTGLRGNSTAGSFIIT